MTCLCKYAGVLCLVTCLSVSGISRISQRGRPKGNAKGEAKGGPKGGPKGGQRGGQRERPKGGQA